MSSNPPNLDVGKMAIEGFGQMMSNVQRAWTNFDLPTPFTPTLSLADLDKRIADLRAVEQWLTLNQNMLRGTIQGLEIQRGTLHAVQSLSDTIGKAVQPPGDQVAQSVARVAADAARAASARSAGPGDGVDNPFDPAALLRLFGPLGAFAPTSPSSPSSPSAPSAPPAPATPTAPAAQAAPTPLQPPSSAAETESAGPLLWWDLLQQNFRRLADAAVVGTNTGSTGGRAESAAGPSAVRAATPASPPGTGKRTDAGTGAATGSTKPPAKARAKPKAKTRTDTKPGAARARRKVDPA